MKKEYLFIIVALVLLGLGVLYSSKKASTVSDQELVSSEGNRVVYTDSGFSPQTLTVKVGTTVTFRNESESQMWVGSDPHPLHTHHPDFDQLGDERTYSFTFTKTGNYHYHNHLDPSHVGTVMVAQ